MTFCFFKLDLLVPLFDSYFIVVNFPKGSGWSRRLVICRFIWKVNVPVCPCIRHEFGLIFLWVEHLIFYFIKKKYKKALYTLIWSQYNSLPRYREGRHLGQIISMGCGLIMENWPSNHGSCNCKMFRIARTKRATLLLPWQNVPPLYTLQHPQCL